MKKRNLIPVLFVSLSTLIINFASAQFYGGYGRGFSITDFINSIGPDNLTFMALFIIFFALLFYALGKFFKDSYGYPNKPIAGTISFTGSIAVSYGLYRSGFNLENFFNRFGFSFNLTPVLVLIISLFAIWIIWFLGRRKEFGRTTFSLKKGLGALFILLGVPIMLLTVFTDIFYEKFTAFIIGLILSVIGFLLLIGRRIGKRINGGPSPQVYPDDYGRKAQEIKNRLMYERYKELEEEQRRQEIRRKRLQAVAKRRGKISHEEAAKQRYIRKFGKRAWEKREREGMNF